MTKMAVPLSFFLSMAAMLRPTSAAYKIALVPKMKAAEAFYGLSRDGCELFSNTTGNMMCLYNGTEQPDVEGNLEIIEQLIDDPSIDGIIVSVLDPEAYAPVINRGMALGKPIVTFDSDAPDSNRLAYVGTNNEAMGRELAKLLKQVKPDGGTYGIVSGFGNSDNLNSRVKGVREVLADTPWKEVAGSPKNGMEDSAISLQQMWVLVEENPDIDAIVSVVGLPMFPDDTSNWTNFVDSNRDVLTVIADALPVQLKLMQTSYVDALVGQLPYNMGYQSAQTMWKVLKAVDSGVPLNETLESDTIFGTHQLEILRIPLQLPPLDFDYNYIGNAAIVGYILCAIIMIASLAFTGWTWFYRRNQVVRSGQPVFLCMICIGTLLMGSAIIPLSIDDEKSQRAADVACMCSPWLINIGFTIAFSALFSKTWRLNKILLSKNPLRRVKVTEKDVIWPLVVLLSLNTITLICWTAIAPLRFVRTLEAGTDPWNRSIGSYGHCESTSGAAGKSIPYMVVIGVVNLTALIVANYQAYRARNVRTEFNESSYIAMANASFLQAICICIPIIFLTRTNPQAYFIVLSVVLFILSGAILVFVFVPKIVALRDRKKNGMPKRTSIRISGLNSTAISNSGTGSRNSSSRASSKFSSAASRGSIASSVDPVTSVLQQYQALSWENKMEIKKKLSLTNSSMSSRTLEQFESSGEIVESTKDDGNGPIVESAENEDEEPTRTDVVPESISDVVVKKDADSGVEPDAATPESPV